MVRGGQIHGLCLLSRQITLELSIDRLRLEVLRDPRPAILKGTRGMRVTEGPHRAHGDPIGALRPIIRRECILDAL